MLRKRRKARSYSTKRRVRRRRRRNPQRQLGGAAMMFGTRHRPVMYKRKGRGYRSPLYRLHPRKVNKKRSRRKYGRRRNPFRSLPMRQYFGKARMMNAVSLLIGLGGSAGLKAYGSRMFANEWFDRLYGVASIILGAMLNMRGRRPEMKAIGTGMVVFGLYDALVSNIPALAQFLPTIGKPAFISGYDSYGRSTYLGASTGYGDVEVVGGNISMDMTPDIIGSEMDLDEALEMSA